MHANEAIIQRTCCSEKLQLWAESQEDTHDREEHMNRQKPSWAPSLNATSNFPCQCFLIYEIYPLSVSNIFHALSPIYHLRKSALLIAIRNPSIIIMQQSFKLLAVKTSRMWVKLTEKCCQQEQRVVGIKVTQATRRWTKTSQVLKHPAPRFSLCSNLHI